MAIDLHIGMGRIGMQTNQKGVAINWDSNETLFCVWCQIYILYVIDKPYL